MPFPLSPARRVPLHSPLDTESQYNSIVTLQGLLALVCGTGIPHLTGNTSQQKVTGRQTEQLGTQAGCQQSHKSSEMRKQAVCHLGTCLPGPQAEISLSRKGKFLQRVRLKLMTLHSGMQQSPPCHLSQPRPTPHTEPKKLLSGSCFSNSQPIPWHWWHCKASAAAAGFSKLSTHGSPSEGKWCPEQPGQWRKLFAFNKVQQCLFSSMWLLLSLKKATAKLCSLAPQPPAANMVTLGTVV